MTKHCSTIIPPTNFPSEFSYGKRHNIDLEITQSKIAPSKLSPMVQTSPNSNIKSNQRGLLQA